LQQISFRYDSNQEYEKLPEAHPFSIIPPTLAHHLSYSLQIITMNKKTLLTALVLGAAVTVCILKLASPKKAPKMNAKPENWVDANARA
jgi:hypothetical protein